MCVLKMKNIYSYWACISILLSSDWLESSATTFEGNEQQNLHCALIISIVYSMNVGCVYGVSSPWSKFIVRQRRDSRLRRWKWALYWLLYGVECIRLDRILATVRIELCQKNEFAQICVRAQQYIEWILLWRVWRVSHREKKMHGTRMNAALAM